MGISFHLAHLASAWVFEACYSSSMKYHCLYKYDNTPVVFEFLHYNKYLAKPEAPLFL